MSWHSQVIAEQHAVVALHTGALTGSTPVVLQK